jgi:DNA adenine methylase
MYQYNCDNCGKEFKQKSQYEKHQNKKKHCIPKENVIENTTTEEIEIKNNYSYPLNPIIKWSGGKKDELKHILPHIPKNYNIYLEPFIGGGALYFHINPKMAVINDVHKELIDFYTSIKNGHSNEIYEFMKSHQNDEETYYKVRKYNNNEILDNAKRFYYLRKTCFRGMLRYNSKGEFNIPFGRYKSYHYEEIKNKEYESLLQRTEIFNESFEYIFDNYNDKNNFMFLDPPYDSEFVDYGYCQFGKEEHKKLAEKFKNTNIRCLMIIGKTDFIESLYKDYIVGDYNKKYRFKLHSGRIGDEINTKHLIIKNY